MKKQQLILKNHQEVHDKISINAQLEIYDKTIIINFKIEGEVDNYIFPLPSKQKRGHELWKATCFELFLGYNNQTEYQEINISPLAEWNHYSFTNYRKDLKENLTELNPLIKTLKTKESYSISFESDFEERIIKNKLIFNLAVILLDHQGTRHFYTINRKEKEVNFHLKKQWNSFL